MKNKLTNTTQERHTRARYKITDLTLTEPRQESGGRTLADHIISFSQQPCAWLMLYNGLTQVAGPGLTPKLMLYYSFSSISFHF